MREPSLTEMTVCGGLSALVMVASVIAALTSYPLWASVVLLSEAVILFCWSISFPIRIRRAARSGGTS